MKKLLFVGPVLTSSGYGEHARQLLRAFIDSGLYDISVEPIRWGNTPALRIDQDGYEEIVSLWKKHDENAHHDISVQVTIPNEFKRRATFNVGVTAGIEVDRASPAWIAKCNESADVVIVPSTHSARSLADVKYSTQDGKELSLKRPLFIAPEGFDPRFFNTEKRVSKHLDALKIKTQFNFLSVGLGMDKDKLGEDRKNISLLVKLFLEEFARDERVGLILKAGIVNGSLMDFNVLKSRISSIRQQVGCGEFPRIYLVHGNLSKEELSEIYRDDRVKSYVTFTHGEGFGLPILEAAACGLPVIATEWSGHLDFLHNSEGKKLFVPVKFQLGAVPDSMVWEHVIEKGTGWANVDESDARSKMKKVFLSYEKPKTWALELAASLAKTHSQDVLGKQLVQIISKFFADATAGAENSPTLKDMKEQFRKRLNIPDGKKTLLYTMPMSAGDVFISTAVVDSLKKKFPEHLVVFATDKKYADILKENPNIFKVISFENWMMDIASCERVFDEVYTPNLAIQMNTSNWVHGGKGRLLGDEIAHQCGVPFGKYFIQHDPVGGLPKKYIVFHPGSGKGQWEARKYNHWKSVVHNVKKHTGLPIVQVGTQEDPLVPGCEDFRGRTTYNQLAYVVKHATVMLGIDSVVMHMAAAHQTALVTIFGSSYASSTGPVLKHDEHNTFLIDTPNRMGCEKACYKYQCTVDRESPCSNEIDPKLIAGNVVELVTVDHEAVSRLYAEYEEIKPKIAGYTHVLNAKSHGFPFVESIRSMLGFCDEVIVVDGGSDDGTVEDIKNIFDPRIKIFERKWDWSEPGMDGMQKAFGRAMTTVGTDDFLWQQDADEVVHEDDYDKIKKMVLKFPSDVDVIHLPVVELWGDIDSVRTDRHSWKWRLSRNNFRVTHGINKNARVFDEKTGKTFAKKGMSDGCEYVDIMTGEFLPHRGFYTQQLELLRQKNPQEYGKAMNKIFAEIPSVFHYSWASIPQKIVNFKKFWNACWSNLYNDSAQDDRFPSVDLTDTNTLFLKAREMKEQGGEHGKAETFKLERRNPKLMLERVMKSATILD